MSEQTDAIILLRFGGKPADEEDFDEELDGEVEPGEDPDFDD